MFFGYIFWRLFSYFRFILSSTLASNGILSRIFVIFCLFSQKGTFFEGILLLVNKYDSKFFLDVVSLSSAKQPSIRLNYASIQTEQPKNRSIKFKVTKVNESIEQMAFRKRLNKYRHTFRWAPTKTTTSLDKIKMAKDAIFFLKILFVFAIFYPSPAKRLHRHRMCV